MVDPTDRLRFTGRAAGRAVVSRSLPGRFTGREQEVIDALRSRDLHLTPGWDGTAVAPACTPKQRRAHAGLTGGQEIRGRCASA
ncbi:hypothetical protein SMD11_1210 [Streptomyces albireticuli]|uniref:Uncharacterized protein n=1 Tax=Streptomyces albireticuli TaxID=1940 RepID=A0A1Z2KY56_9ACTN|nr:hypothetical protein SMD11_1210 [Streptomyces albireticuli]